MEPKSIMLIIVTILLLYVVVSYVIKDVNSLTGLISAETMQKIEATSLDTSSSSTSNFTYSIWFYINDWNYRYGDPKVLFGRMNGEAGAGDKNPCPSVVLGAIQNNLAISLTVYPGEEQTPADGQANIVHTCSVANIPIQKWVNLFVSVYGRTMDIYIDGKLVRTCILPGVAKIDANAPVYITPMGGFSGWTSRFQYWSESSDPQKAWDIYKKGYGGSLLGSLFGKYSIKVSLMEGDTEQKTVTI